MEFGRRRFLGQMGVVSLAALSAHAHWAQAGARPGVGYGALRPARDQRGVAVLALPEGFTLTTFSRTGEAFDRGVVPRNLDGMAAFDRPGGLLRLIRNHEVRNRPGEAAGAVPGAHGPHYDPRAGGGCMVLDYDPVTRTLARQFVGLAGTHVNCAGGYAWQRRAWLSCEETTDGPKQGYAKKHGYVYALPAELERAVDPVPLVAMGRFKHEAACADAEGVVYLTEDAGSGRGSGFYRYLPNDRADLAKGGRLQMLRAKAAPYLDARQNRRVGKLLACDWVTLSDPDPDLEAGAPGCFEQGRLGGGTQFNRLEGLWLGRDGKTVFFSSTSGGDAKGPDINQDGYVQGYGQIWRYTPVGAHAGALALHFESPGASVLDSPDNLCVTPRGGLLVCEDDASPGDSDRHPLAQSGNVNRLVGLGSDGAPFTFAVNLLNDSELTGATFSPDGGLLFVNLFGDGRPDSGMSCAIAGPWARGPL